MKFFIKLHKFKGERLRGFRQYTKVTYELYAFKFLEIGIRHLRSVPLQLVHFYFAPSRKRMDFLKIMLYLCSRKE